MHHLFLRTLTARQCGSLIETARLMVRSIKDSRRPGAASPGMTQPLGPGLSAWPALSPDKQPVVNTLHPLHPPSAVSITVYVEPPDLHHRAHR